MPKSKDDPTAELVFVERITRDRTVNILHQYWVRPDGSRYLREVSKITQAAAERLRDPDSSSGNR